MPKKYPPINYTSRDYESIRNSLIDYVKRYYPNTFKDFSDSSFGLMTLETVAYVGDILSFYLDYASSESFLDTAIEYNNVVRHARNKGFKLNSNPSSYGEISLYIQVPALASGLGPDFRFAPVIKKNSQFSSRSGSSFLLIEDVDFANTEKIEVVVAQIDDSNGLPSSYAIKAKGRIISGELRTDVINVGSFQKFRKLKVGTNRIAEIMSIVDSEGHEYYEVPNLSQDIIYKKILNRNSDKLTTPNILKPISVARRFVVEKDYDNTYVIFGSGTDSEIAMDDILDPSNTILDVHGKAYINDTSFDPTKLVSSNSFGIAPSNTSLTINYRENTNNNVNASVNSIENVVFSDFKFINERDLNQTQVSFVRNSLQVTNEDPVLGDVLLPNSEEIKIRSKNYFATQDRCVTRTDYMSMAYAMPQELGAIKRVNIFQDKNSFKRNLNLYVVSEDQDGNLIEANSTLKENLKSWLNINKMINDTIDILDAKIINFGITFQIIAERDKNKYDVLERAVRELSNKFSNKYDIGEPILISDMYNLLNEVDGVEDVVDVRIVKKTGLNYSQTGFNFDLHTTPDGRMINSYKNVIFELKYPNQDVAGSVL